MKDIYLIIKHISVLNVIEIYISYEKEIYKKFIINAQKLWSGLYEILHKNI